MLVICMMFYGCASIVSKSSYPVALNSQPEGADVTVTDETGKVVFNGKTPTTITLDTKKGYFRGKDYKITFCKEGCSSYTTQLKKSVDGWYIFGNLFFGGLIGYLIVDPLTGAMWTLDKEVIAVLDQEVQSTLKASNLNIFSLEDVPENIKHLLVRVR